MDLGIGSALRDRDSEHQGLNHIRGSFLTGNSRGKWSGLWQFCPREPPGLKLLLPPVSLIFIIRDESRHLCVPGCRMGGRAEEKGQRMCASSFLQKFLETL